MQITYDKDADILMIRLGERQPIQQEEMVNNRLILQKDAEGNVISLELLDVSGYVVDLSKVDFAAVSRTYAQPQTAK